MENKEHRTTDFYTAVILYYFNFPLIRIEIAKENTWNRGIFIFSDTEELQNIVSDYLQRKIQIEPNKFISIIKDLKSTVSSLQNRTEGNLDVIVRTHPSGA